MAEDSRWQAAWALAALVRAALLAVPGHAADLASFHAWAVRLVERSPWRFYGPDVFVDYLPGYLLVLWPVGGLLRAFPGLGAPALKAVPAAADFAVAWLLYRLGGPRGRKAALAYLWNPAVLLVGAWWGQAESVALAWLLAGVWAWQRGRPGWAGFLFGLGALTKPQYALPGLVLWAGSVRGWPPARLVARSAAGCLAAGVAGGLVFGLLPWDLLRLASDASSTYPYGSVNALNVWYLAGWNWKPDSSRLLGLPVAAWGLSLAAAASGWTVWCWAGRADVGSAALAAGAVQAAVFAFATRMHERYLFPAVPLVLLAWARGRASGRLAAMLSLALLANLAYGLAYLASSPQYSRYMVPLWASVWRAMGPPVSQALAALTVAVAGWALASAVLAPRPRSRTGGA